MKILKRNDWSHRFTCTGCKSELLAEPDDIKAGTFGGSYCETGDLAWYVECVVCGTDLILDGHASAKPKSAVFIPADIKNRAQNKLRNR